MNGVKLFWYRNGGRENMKKRIGAILCVVMLAGCSEASLPPTGVTEVVWLQEDGSDYQLFLGADGAVSYYSPGAGNPYHDFDLCETYTYDKSTQEFLFESSACSMTFVRVDADGKTLQLVVDGDPITYRKSEE